MKETVTGTTVAKQNTVESELYVKAIRSLHKANKVSEHHKVAELPQERDLMRETNRQATRYVSAMPYTDGQYEQIFKRVGKNET